ncbi:MAG TPA: lysylphosphatidylglycerol synthase transmembrane domain-containing protein [Solirubrobacteraceae bacterium]|nr:lysylphosphatidylglycerol synthase transmembrane domain-containing protein [Solirubrobacteraceae bacterium]
MSGTEVDRKDQAVVLADDLELPQDLSRRKVRRQLLVTIGIIVVAVALVTLLPGLEALRTRLSHAKPGWLLLGVVLKVLSALGYVVVFRMVFCRRMSWRVSYQIGMSEVGANALLPTGGAGGLALGAWALKRGGMPGAEIARRTVAFFLLTSVANVVGVIILGSGLALEVFPGETKPALTLLPAVVAAMAIIGSLLAGRSAAGLHRRLERSEKRQSSRRERAALKTVVAIADGVNEAVALLREGNAWLIGGLLAYLLFDVMILWATFRAFGAAPPLAILSIAYLIGELGGLIPIPGGIGGVDVGLVGTFVLYGVPLTAAASAVLAYRAIALWVPAVLGSAAFISLRRTLRHEAAELAVCAPDTEMDVIGLGRVVISSPGQTAAP